MKKKIIGIMMTATLVMGFSACGSSSNESGAETESNSADSTGVDNADTEREDSSENTVTTEGKTLVVYYSATGNTEKAAGLIAEQTGGDLFELTPTQPYTDDDLDWTNDDSRVSVEHDDEAQRHVELEAVTTADWDSYDIVYIGYPIWWGIAAWPVDTFVKANDFTGKTVITFATAASSGMGQSSQLLAEMAGTGDWVEGECFR